MFVGGTVGTTPTYIETANQREQLIVVHRPRFFRVLKKMPLFPDLLCVLCRAAGALAFF